MQDKGFDILTAAEFSCFVPDFEIGIHVLAYGFSPEQEARLEKLRKNLYNFLEYACAQNIPTVWAHPLYHYSVKTQPPLDFFNKMLLVFERFEVVNGQRDTWQNLLVKEWLNQSTPEHIDRYAKQFGIAPNNFCADPYRKAVSGGSDCHIGIFAGTAGTNLYVPDLQRKLLTTPRSTLALEAIRKGDMSPFGMYQNAEKMTITFLDYVCQVALNYKDAGLVRLLLHKGSTNSKLLAFALSNLFSEIQKHKVTKSFIRTFHDCLMGEKTSFIKKLFIKRTDYREIFDEIINLSNKKMAVDNSYNSIEKINFQLNKMLATKAHKKLQKINLAEISNFSPSELLEKLELPAYIRSYVGSNGRKNGVNISKLLDGLSFPFFGSLLILGAHFTSAKSMCNTRPLLKEFSAKLNKYQQPERIMWLTDTYGDPNGVMVFFTEMLAEIRKHNYPIDIVCCSSKIKSEANLIVLPPVSEFSLPAYRDYTFKIPNFLELHNLFLYGGYDRVICSTEGVLGAFGLYLKHAYSVEATFYLHNDWLMFARKVFNVDGHNLNRLRRMLRYFYKAFDNLLVLNSDQKKWLSGSKMNLNPDRVFLTSHWVNKNFKPLKSNKKELFGLSEDVPVLLYTGRLAREKGVLELSEIYAQAVKVHHNLKLVIVGKGPDFQILKEQNPDAVFVDWVEHSKLPEIYSSADLFVLPSRFDTFCNSVLEALACGLPVVAYGVKGPKDIVRNGQDGFLVNTQNEFVEKIIFYLNNKEKEIFKQSAVERAASYTAKEIMQKLLKDVGVE
jgi:glycosyltransferase involved in cell wall biosynthesis